MNVQGPSSLPLLPLAAAAADVPKLGLPQAAGVNIHFVTGHEQEFDTTAAAGQDKLAA